MQIENQVSVRTDCARHRNPNEQNQSVEESGGGNPVKNKPDYSQQFIGIYSLYNQVKDFPTHDVRKAQSKIETKKQDLQREELEAQLESQILRDVSVLKTFDV